MAFVGFIVAMLVVDLFMLYRDAHEVSLREAGLWSVIWVVLGLAFGVIVWIWRGPEPAGQYIAGYVIERSLSVDNLFVFALIFGYFAVPSLYQHRVLMWGVMGALVLRAVFIAAGVTLLESFHWTIYVFGALLLVTGIRLARSSGNHVDPGRNPVLRLVQRLVPMTEDYDDQRMVVRQGGRLMVTPLLAVVIVVATTDVVFAVDSIPAVLAVTRDPFLVFTSNAFAILGLRALYFLLAGMMDRFRHLKIGLAAVLVFVGVKMLASDVFEPPIWASLVVIGATIGASVAASLVGPWADASRTDVAE
jgi:tellurite resistance protein TerC